MASLEGDERSGVSMMAMTTPAQPHRRVWRTRAFIQPLLVTIVGVAALPAIFMAWSLLVGPSDDSSSPCTGECGTARLASAFLKGIALLVVWCVVMLFSGFGVGRSSRDSSLAFRAVLVAVVSLALSVSIGYTLVSTTSESLLDTVFVFLGLAIVPLVPVALGFGVGRMVRRSHDG
jgi:hypothetical protein